MSMEVNMTPEQRSLHQWQLLATRGKRQYIIVKGGANTIGYRINDSEWTYVHPTKMLDILNDWGSIKYIGYKLMRGNKILRKSRDVRELLEMEPTHTATIVGVTPTHKDVTLYKWQTGVFQSEWQATKRGK